MPIIFRCKSCNQKLSASSRKAGKAITCPACGAELSVPVPESAQSPDDLDDRIEQPPAETPPPSLPPEIPEPVSEWDAVSSSRPQIEEEFPQETAEYENLEGGFEESDLDVPAFAPPPEETEEDEDDGLVLRSAATEFEDMDLTPMVDVTFLLLIFFMITASFSIQKTLAVPPPDPDDGQAQDVQPQDTQEQVAINVAIDEKNAITVDDESLPDPSGLVDKIQSIMRQDQKREMTLRAHPDALHETMILAIDAANEAGIQKINVVVEE